MSLSREARWLLEEKYRGEKSPEFAADCERLALGEPLAYVIGWQPFCGLKIYLDSKPLIPRPETEWWTAELGREIEGRLGARRRERQEFSSKKISVSRERPAEFRVLDLCAGSGAIGCALLKLAPSARVSFGELAARHEATIYKNIRENGLEGSRAEVRIGDLFQPFAGERFDLIAANPPYVPERRALPDSVAAYEPAEALYAGPDGLALIERVARELPAHLAPGGQAWIECDSAHAARAAELFRAQGFSAAVLHDQYDVPRVIVVSSAR